MPKVDSVWEGIQTILALECSDAQTAVRYYKRHYDGDFQSFTAAWIVALSYTCGLSASELDPHVKHMMCVAHSSPDITLEDFFLLMETQMKIVDGRPSDGESDDDENFLSTLNDDLKDFIADVNRKTRNLDLDDKTRSVLFSDSRILMAYIHQFFTGDTSEFIRRPSNVYAKYEYNRDFRNVRQGQDTFHAYYIKNTSNHSLVEEKRQLAELAKRAAPVKPAPKPVKKQGFLRKLFS
ncbi:MAG: hypothetical protein GY793_07110 [Proteobacteria bacterium]|nr:hypothetical protein [Pseudomonadota bacterium]